MKQQPYAADCVRTAVSVYPVLSYFAITTFLWAETTAGYPQLDHSIMARVDSRHFAAVQPAPRAVRGRAKTPSGRAISVAFSTVFVYDIIE